MAKRTEKAAEKKSAGLPPKAAEKEVAGLPAEVADKFELSKGIKPSRYYIPRINMTVDVKTMTLAQAEYIAAKDPSFLVPIKKK